MGCLEFTLRFLNHGGIRNGERSRCARSGWRLGRGESALVRRPKTQDGVRIDDRRDVRAPPIP